MKNILYLIFLLSLLDFEVKSDENEEISSQLNVDVKKIRPRKWKIIRKKNIINTNFNNNNNNNNDYYYNGGDNNEDTADVFNLQWRGNGDFGKKNSDDFSREKLFRSEDKFDFFLHNGKGEENEDEEFPSSPSRRLEPPFKFYSSSIHDFATENTEKSTTTTTESTNNSQQNSLRIYEITSSNSSSLHENNKNYGRAFMIDDPSKELNKFDSLRSVISNQPGNYHENNLNYNENYSTINSSPVVDYNEDKLLNINGDSEIRANGLLIKRNKIKSYYSNRGNRKYQHAVDNDEIRLVRDKTWFDPTNEKYTWKKIQRPINRVNNYKRFGTIARVDSRTNRNDNTENGAIPGEPGIDYPIYHQHSHHRLQNVAARFLCPINAESHVYLADRASRCQIFYVCFGGDIGVPMVCPNGTLFSQELQVCDWWYNVTC